MRDNMGLYKGKRNPNGEWVEGNLIIFPKTKRTKIMVWEWADLDFNAIEVRPETVGQYTGRTDKNRKRIFEGDVVRCVRTGCDGKTMVGYIVFDDCCFSVKERKTPNQPAMDLCDDFEIIGNIHDNPELLEVK